MRIQLTIAAALLPLSADIFAQDAAATAGEYFGELPVVLSASRLVQRVDQAPAAVTVIDREMIRASGARDIVDLFRLVPGMTVGWAKGHKAVLGLHGFADPLFRQLQILVDGVSIYSPAWGGGDWSELPLALEDIERIEVVRGPNAATFGANSFLGVVNIITRDPATERGAKVSGNIGENGIRDVVVRYVANREDFRYRLTAGQRSDAGLDAYPDSRRNTFANLRGHYRLSSTDELRLQASYVGGAQEEGIYAKPNHDDGQRTSHFDAGNVQLRWARMRGPDDDFWIQASHAERSHRETLPYVLNLAPVFVANYPLNFDYSHRRTDIELQRTMRLDDSWRGVWGTQVRVDGAKSRTYLGTDDWRTSRLYRLFGNLEWRPAAPWIVWAGAMLENNSLTGTSVSPSVAVIREIVPDHSLRIRLANARRTPTLFEDNVNWRYEAPAALKALLPAPLAVLPLFQSRLTRDNLEDERIRSSELSYLGRVPSLRLNVDLSAFEYRLDRLINWYKFPYPTIFSFFYPSTLNVPGYANLDSARVRGQSASLRLRPWSGGDVAFAASRTSILAEGPDAQFLSSSAPVHTVSLLLAQELPSDWVAGLGYYRVGPMQVLSGGDPLPATDKIDLRLAKRFRLGGSRAEVALVVRNATGDIPTFERKDVDRRTSWLNVRYEH